MQENFIVTSGYLRKVTKKYAIYKGCSFEIYEIERKIFIVSGDIDKDDIIRGRRLTDKESERMLFIEKLRAESRVGEFIKIIDEENTGETNDT